MMTAQFQASCDSFCNFGYLSLSKLYRKIDPQVGLKWLAVMNTNRTAYNSALQWLESWKTVKKKKRVKRVLWKMITVKDKVDTIQIYMESKSKVDKDASCLPPLPPALDVNEK